MSTGIDVRLPHLGEVDHQSAIGHRLASDVVAAPNEKFDLDHYAMGVRVLARLWDEIGKEMA